MSFLKQSTAVILKMGPFVDDTDFKSLETGLTIAQADIQISKAGGAYAQTSDASPTTTHDADAWYPVPLTATDTGTVGIIKVQVAMTGALPVWEEHQVIEEATYDALFGASAAGFNASGAVTLAAATHTGAVIPTVTTLTGHTAQTGDSFARLGAPAGASIAADIATVDTVADAIKVITDALPDSGALSSLAQGAALTTVDGVVDAIKVVTDALTAAGAANLALSAAGILGAAVNDGAATTTTFIADGFTEATDDHFNGRIIVFTSGALANQATDITDYTGATQTFTVTALTSAPANDDTFVIV